MKKKKLLILIVSIIMMLCASVSALAYFVINSNSYNIVIDKDLNNDLIEINEMPDLLLYARDNTYNSSSEKADLTYNRKTLILKNDIVFTRNLSISSNVNLDLNGHKIYLNGYNLTFMSYYYGTFGLYSNLEYGYIIPNEIEYVEDSISLKENGNSGRVIIYTKNETILNHNNIKITKPDLTELTTSDYISVVDETRLIDSYNALLLVRDSLQDYSSLFIPEKEFDNIINYTTRNGSSGEIVFDSSLFIPKKLINNESFCSYCDGSIGCAFVYRDLILPYSLYNDSRYKIKYESSNTSVISNSGKYFVPESETDVTLNVYIYFEDELVASSSFLLHVLNLDTDDSIKFAKTIFFSRIQEHYSDTENMFVLNKEILLPRIISNVTYTYVPYKVSNRSGAVTLFDGDSTTYESLGTSNVKVYTDVLMNFQPTSETSAMGITLTYGNYTETFYIHIKSENIIVSNETSVARDIINDWYGGAIKIRKVDALNNVYDSVILKNLNDVDTVKYTGVTNIVYELINDTHNLYQISADSNPILSVKNQAIPEAYVQDVMLSVTFTIEDKNINIQIPIKVEVSESEMASSFLPYYTYYDELIKNTYNNYITSSFTIPFAYSNTGPVVVIDFVEIPTNYDSLNDKTFSSVNPSNLDIYKVSLFYNGAIRTTLSFSQGVSYTTALDTYLGENKQEKLREILAYGDAKWIFDVKVANMASKNLNIGLIYNYKMTYLANDYLVYKKNDTTEQIISSIIEAGILHYGSDVTNETFYKWIYDNFTTLTDSSNNKYVYTIGDYTTSLTNPSQGKFVLVDWLGQNVAIDAKTDNIIASITDFTGISFLKGTKYLCLTNSSNVGLITNSSVAISLAREIAQMTSLETLILENCTGFTDGFDPTNSTSQDNDSISRFVSLRNLDTLNLNGCNIYLFDFLDQMTWLNEVYIANQSVSSNANYSNFYGNTGISNFYVFADLTDSGVKVYNTSQGSGYLLFQNSTTTNDYTRLRYGLIYQSSLANGEDITKLYSTFSTNPSDYMLNTNYSNGNITIDSSSRNITFGYLEYALTSDTTVDANKTYYQKDDSESSGYKAITNPSNDDISTYYEHLTATTSTAFTLTYSFNLSDGTSVRLIVKFKVKRY